MISNKLIEEIIYISSKNKFIDKEMVLKILIDSMKEDDDIVKRRLNGLTFNRVDSGVASCDKKRGIIVVDIYKIYNQKNSNEYVYLSILSYNLFIVQCILHELQHLKEFYQKNENDFESLLIKYSSSEFLYYNIKNDQEKRNLFYKKVYKLIPNERLANINSSEALLQSLNNYPNFSLNYLDSLLFINNLHIDYFKIGYILQKNYQYNFPLYEYLNVIGIDLKTINYILEIVNEFNDIDSKTKMKYGLQITTEDINNLNKMKIKKI